MLTTPQARELAAALADEAVQGGSEDWRRGAALLAALNGRDWLALDDAARSTSYAMDAPVSGTRGWLGESLVEPTGFVATVTSLHRDGRIRQRAVRVLAQAPGRLAAAALALRAMDHVREVREEALGVLVVGLHGEQVEPALAVLLAGRDRQHTATAIQTVQAAITASVPVPDLVAALTGSADREVRRWGFDLAHRHQLLPVTQLSAAVRSDPDQLLRKWCARWLVEVAAPADLRDLLPSRSADARLVAATCLPDGDLPDEMLLPLLGDRAALVRGRATARAQHRGLDIAAWYRDQLGQAAGSASRIAACLTGLTGVGRSADLGTIGPFLQHPTPRVRAAAASGVGALGEREEILALLEPLLLDASPRVSTVAALVLARAGATAAQAARAWPSAQAWSRRAAWRLTRAAGSWNRVEADLRAAIDPDPNLARLGQAGIRNWLQFGAATTWAVLDQPQRDRLRRLLQSGRVDERLSRVIAFHAGIRWPLVERTGPVAVDQPAAPGQPRGRWLRLLRRS